MFEGEVQFVGAGSGICFLPDEGGGSTEGVDGAGMVADPGSGLDWMVDTAGYGSGISGSGSQTYTFESILKIYWVKTNNFFDNFLVADPDPGKSEGGDSREVRRVGGGVLRLKG